MFPFLLLRSVMKRSTRTSNKIMWDYIAFANGTKHKTTNHKTNFIPSVDNDESTYLPNNYYSITCEIFRIYILKYFEIFFIIATHNIFQSQRFWLIIHYSGQSKN